MRRHFIGFFLLFAVASPLRAQDTTKAPPGIALTGVYSASDRPNVAVRPFSGAGVTQTVLDSMYNIVKRDVEYSDRFIPIATPAALATGAVDYRAWNSLSAWYLITGDVSPGASGYDVTITVHDVVYSKVKDTQHYRIAASTNSPDFRMTLHAIADEAVRVISGQPGIAATRVAFTRQNKPTVANGTTTYDLLIVDSDGFGLRRIAGGKGQLYSPAWSPDGKRLAYVIGGTNLIEHDMQTGATRTLHSQQGLQTPAYSPDGSRIMFAAWTDKVGGAELFQYDARNNCCLKRLTTYPRDDIGPSFSPDGAQVAFMSSRLGLPQIYVMQSSGGGASLLSPYVSGLKGYYFGPDWSPTGSEVAFAGHWNSQGIFQIMIADTKRMGGQIRQITKEGDNEDPSWAPDGRHIAYSFGVGESRLSLYVIDAVTLTKRRVADGTALRMADWSPLLARASDYVVR